MTLRGRGFALAIIGAAGSLVLAMPAAAHHSGGAFDHTKEVTVTGTVKEWRWANPHPAMTIIVADKSGPDASYYFEWPAPAQLQERGWTRNLATVGDKVKITYNPWKNGTPGGLFKDITAADGKSLKAGQ